MKSPDFVSRAKAGKRLVQTAFPVDFRALYDRDKPSARLPARLVTQTYMTANWLFEVRQTILAKCIYEPLFMLAKHFISTSSSTINRKAKSLSENYSWCRAAHGARRRFYCKSGCFGFIIFVFFLFLAQTVFHFSLHGHKPWTHFAVAVIKRVSCFRWFRSFRCWNEQRNNNY